MFCMSVFALMEMRRTDRERVGEKKVLLSFLRKKHAHFCVFFSNSLPESSPAAAAGPAAWTLIAQRLNFSTGTAKVLPFRPFPV